MLHVSLIGNTLSGASCKENCHDLFPFHIPQSHETNSIRVAGQGSPQIREDGSTKHSLCNHLGHKEGCF
jgi:hypothetical protein